jgi:PadR family transcriptional regulator, regulatory protein AphA
MLKYAILGFLAYRRMTGYDIEQWMQASTGHFWHAKISQIYMTLKQIEEQGLVSSHIEAQEGRPDRRIYTLTESGQTTLTDWLNMPIVEPEMKKDSLLLKLFFGLPTGKTALLTQLRLQLDLHRRQKQVYQTETPQEMIRFLVDQPELAQHALMWDLTRRYGELYEETYIQWLGEAITRIEQELDP